MIVATCYLNATSLHLHSYDTVKYQHLSAEDHCAEKWRTLVANCSHPSNPNSNKKQQILYIHVGKSAGSSIKKVLKITKLPFLEMHVAAVSSGMLRQYSDVVIAVREPLDRLISAFYWRSPRADALRKPLSPQHAQATGIYHEFYNCFSSANDFASALYEDSRCGQLARAGEGHIFWNVCAYLGGLREELRQHPRVFVVDTENLLEDVNTVLRETLPGLRQAQHPQRRQYTLHELPSAKSYNKSSIYEPLTPENEERVRRYLRDTGVYQMYRTIHEVAINRRNI